MNLLKPSVPILNFMRFRGSRHPREKLQKPEDKSSVILGKWKPSVAYPKPGVSDKAVSYIVLSSCEASLLILFYRIQSTSNGRDQSTYRPSTLLSLGMLAALSTLVLAALTSVSHGPTLRNPRR